MKGKINDFLGQNKATRPESEFEDKEFVPSKAAKINNDRSSVKVKNPLPRIADLAHKLVKNEQEQMKMLQEYGGRFVSLLKDKTLDENKSPTERDEEKQLIAELGSLCRLINDEPQHNQDIGSLAYINLIARLLLTQRDRINELEFELKKAKK